MNTKVYFDGKLNQSEIVEVLHHIPQAPLKVIVPFSILGTKTPDVVRITAASAELSLKPIKPKS